VIGVVVHGIHQVAAQTGSPVEEADHTGRWSCQCQGCSQLHFCWEWCYYRQWQMHNRGVRPLIYL